jgi:undecaprenyl-diphosphatase
MNLFDSSIISVMNSFAGKSFFVDQVINISAHTGLFKGGVIATLMWWAWFKKSDDASKNQRHIVATLVASFFALFIARVLATTLPHRARPIHNPGIIFQPPHGVASTTLDGWSSFPSDHATLFFTLTAGLFFVSRKIGIIATVYCFFIIVLTRIYLGLHYPTDLLAGAALGVAIAYLANTTRIFDGFTNFGLRLHQTRPAVFYPLMFLITYQIATMFIDVRDIGSAAFKYFKAPAGVYIKQPT